MILQVGHETFENAANGGGMNGQWGPDFNPFNDMFNNDNVSIQVYPDTVLYHVMNSLHLLNSYTLDVGQRI